MSVERLEVPGGELLIRVDGDFGAPDAFRVREEMQQAGRSLLLVLDFGQVRAFEDFAIALLAPDLAVRGARCRVRGLGQHQRRILEYFGVKDPESDDGARRDEEPAEARALTTS